VGVDFCPIFGAKLTTTDICELEISKVVDIFGSRTVLKSC